MDEDRAGCPTGSLLRFDFYGSLLLQGVVAEAAPFPVGRSLSETALHGVPVQITQLHRELFLVADVAVEVAGLPQGSAIPVGWVSGEPRLGTKERSRIWGTVVRSLCGTSDALQRTI